MKNFFVAAALGVSTLTTSIPALGQAVKRPHLEAELIAATTSVMPGSTVLVGVRLKMEKGWHTYWRNPGDSGEPNRVDWKLPAGFSASPLLWPAPSRIAVPPLVNFGYDGEVILLSEVMIGKREGAAKSVTLGAEASWLVCSDVCIPGKAELTLTLPWSTTPGKPSKQYAELDRVRATVPSESPQWKVEATAKDKVLELILRGPTGGLTGAEFYPFSESLIQNAAEQKVTLTDGELRLVLTKSQFADGEPKEADWQGVVVLKGEQSPPLLVAPKVAPAMSAAMSSAFWEALLFAFLGGLVLNLMPCVFPVLCLKVLSFAQLSGAQRRKALHHSIAYTMGILVSFWVLAGTLIALRAGGQALGWGFQLQSPTFLALICFLLVAMSLNLMGVFEMGSSMMGVGSKYADQEGWAGAFFSGVLATVVATPCTAPFMGTAMGYALAQPSYVALSVFSFLGLGLASPYLVFSAFPQLTTHLPRPGAWMVIFKQLMSFPLLATVAFLIWVFCLQTSALLVFQLLIGLIVLAMGLWIYGLPTKNYFRRALLAFFFILVSLIATVRQIRQAPATGAATAVAQDGWQTYSEDALAKARATGSPVFIDFTAAWCITCQVNEQVALSVSAVKERFKEKKVILFKADWTNQDEAIAKKLESYGRNGVPLYALYPPGETSQVRLLPQILTPDIVLAALDAL